MSQIKSPSLLCNKEKKLTADQIACFQKVIWDFYSCNKREFAWRNCDNPYYIFISEVMLQQTQTHRVVSKFEEFIISFPDFESLSEASLAEVLSVWQGLGYNRRGKYLHQSAQRIVEYYDGFLPDDLSVLVQLPGIGPATAASIAAFAYNAPTIFIETNIRSVFIHTFFNKSAEKIDDKILLDLIAQTVDTSNAREWYYALMDYGVYLKKNLLNPSRKSKHYSKQSKFEGSKRQIRGAIIKILLQQKSMSVKDLIKNIADKENRTACVVDDLVDEELITKNSQDILSIKDKL